MKTLPCLLSVLALSLCAAPVLHAQASVDLTASADTYVDQKNPASSYGINDNISIRGTGGGDNNRYSYLQFDISSIDEPIATASLTLTVAFGASNRTASTIQLYGLVYDTTEDALALGLEENTFTNDTAPWAAVRPANFSAPANATGLLSTADTPASGSFSGGSTVTFSSTPALASYLESARLDGLSIVTLVLIENTGQSAAITFASRENDTYAGPTISIATAPIPEPATAAALVGLGSLGLALILRRRTPPSDV